jgi:hypothetical protein
MQLEEVAWKTGAEEGDNHGNGLKEIVQCGGILSMLNLEFYSASHGICLISSPCVIK